MRKIACVLALLIVAPSVQAQPRPMTPSLTCNQARGLVLSRGQIVLITDKPDADRDVLLAHAKTQGFPELWVPRSILVSSIPVLGSGKTDYSAAVDLAKRLQPML